MENLYFITIITFHSSYKPNWTFCKQTYSRLTQLFPFIIIIILNTAAFL